jgi:hypothetical protein
MTVSKARTAITLGALGVICVLMLVLGWRAASSPFPSLGGSSTTTKCEAVKKKKVIYRREITVSVYNDTGRKGLADATMASMEKRKFQPGTVGNAPAGTKVDYVEVRAATADDPAAALVAQQFKPAAKVVAQEDDLGPGVDVILGPRFKKLHVPSPKSLRLPKPKTTCLDNPSPSA